MRTLRKRLTCVNRHDGKKNRIAIAKVQKRYTDIMTSAGWYFVNDGITEGESMWSWERYITLYKPNYKKDFDIIAELELDYLLHRSLYRDIQKAKITNSGVRVMSCLKKLGWIELSYVNKQKHSDFFYNCGYSGNYSTSKLVKLF